MAEPGLSGRRLLPGLSGASAGAGQQARVQGTKQTRVLVSLKLPGCDTDVSMGSGALSPGSARLRLGSGCPGVRLCSPDAAPQE